MADLATNTHVRFNFDSQLHQVVRRTKVYYYSKELQILIWVILLTGLIEEYAMNNLTDILQAITLRLVIASFLLNSGRGIKAIEVCKECLIFLKNEVLIKNG